jgi:hypothetical protein
MTLFVVLNRCEVVSRIKERPYPEGLRNHGAGENSCLLARESHIECRKIQSKKVYNFYFLPNFITYLLTPWSRVLLEKLTGLQLVKNFFAFYGTRRFITTLTSARHLSLSSPHSHIPLSEDPS